MDRVTIGVINYNGKSTLPDTLHSIEHLKYPIFDVIVVDNCSTDGSRDWLQDSYPEVHCICLNSNQGSPAARNVILQQARSDYVFIIDNDIVLEPDTLTRLMCVMKSVPGAAVCHPEIHDTHDPHVSHYNGGWIHYLCALVPRPSHHGERPDYEIFDVVSGGALLIDRHKVLAIGGFDEDYFFNWEDGDCTSRLTLAGYLCLNVPSAMAHHHGKPRGTSKVFYQVRNRWFFILKLYSLRTLFLAAPMLLLFELSQALLLVMKGAAKDYWRANAAVLRQLPRILKKRRAFQRLKVKRDRHWLRAGDLYIPGDLLGGGWLKAIKKIYCGFFAFYWRAIRPLC